MCDCYKNRKMNPNKRKLRLMVDLKTKSEDSEVWNKKLKINRGYFRNSWHHSLTWHQIFKTIRVLVTNFLPISNNFITYFSTYSKLRKLKDHFDRQSIHPPTTHPHGASRFKVTGPRKEKHGSSYRRLRKGLKQNLCNPRKHYDI